MTDPYNIDNPNRLVSYTNGPGAYYPDHADKINNRKVVQQQFDLIQKQKQEIIEERLYREEMRKSAARSFRYTIIAIVIASLTLLATLVTLFV
ncbi:MAG: hypothetical protein ACK5LF_02235 [Bacteroides xylanisolvens]